MLKRESPADEEVGRALFEAQVQLKKQRGEDTQDLKFGSNLVFVSSNERFRHFVTSPGKSKTKAFAAMDLECVFVRIGHFFFFFWRGQQTFVHELAGMSVVLFCSKYNGQTVLQLMEQVSKKFPSVNFLKVCYLQAQHCIAK